MANTKSAKKAILVNRRNRARNVHFKSLMKTVIKRAVTALETDAKDKDSLVKEALKTIDKTAAKGVIKKATAARRKSKLAKAANTIVPVKKEEPKKKASKAKSSKATASKTKKKAEAPATEASEDSAKATEKKATATKSKAKASKDSKTEAS